MLFIEHGTREATRVDQWHVGEPLPEITSRVVRFTVGDDELTLLLDTLRRHAAKRSDCAPG
jgi:hypothetical protein